MTKELGLCPFCGGEATVHWAMHRETRWKVYVCCDECAGNIYERARTHYHDAINDYKSEAEAEAAAIKEWNTRYKRTCKMDVIATGEHACYEGYERIFHCCNCGEERAIYAFNEDGDTWSEQPKFCSHCGAEVVDDN